MTKRRVWLGRPGMLGLVWVWLVWAWLLASSAWAALPDHPQVVQRPEPRWVTALEADPSAPTPEGGDRDATYLLVDSQYFLPPSGPSAMYRHYVYRIESRSALEEWSSWEIQLDPSYQRLEVHHLKVFRDGAWQDRLDSSRASLLQREDDLDRQIYDQRRDLVLIYDNIQPGDVVSIAFTLVGQNPVFDGRFTASETLVWGRGMVRRRLRVLSAAERALSYKVFGEAPQPVQRQEGAWRTWTWDDTSVPEAEYEAGAPVGHVHYPFVQLSEFGSWQEVVAWALPLYNRGASRRPPPELVELAERIRTEHAAPEDQLVAARNWVQDNIRYFGVMLGEHSHAPHDSDEILRRHYGDCKDKSILLMELLHLLDIDAVPAFVHSEMGPVLENRLPSPTVFDHVIVVARLGDREVWMDSTLNFQGGSLQHGELSVPGYGFVLPVRPETTSLVSLPTSQTDPGTTEAVYTYDLEEEGQPWTVRIETTYERHQAEEMRSMLDGMSPEELLESYVEHYSTETLQLETLEPLGVVDDRDENLLTTTEVYRVTYQPAHDEDTVFFDTFPLLLSGDLTSLEEDDARQAPYAISQPPRRSERIVLHLPGDFNLEPVEISQETPWFRYEVATRDLEPKNLKPGRIGLEVHYRLETLTDRVVPDELTTYASEVQEVWNSLGYSIWNDGLGGAELRRYAFLGMGAAGLAVLMLGMACLIVLLRWGLI